MNFRKYGSRFYRGRAALLAADVQAKRLKMDQQLEMTPTWLGSFVMHSI